MISGQSRVAILAILALFLFSLEPLSAQELEEKRVVEISAKIVDSDKEPLYMAALVLRDRENKLLALAYADEEGIVSLQLSGQESPSIVVISMVGFRSIRKEITVKEEKCNLGTFTLINDATLDAAIVKAPQLVNWVEDAYVYNVERDPLAKKTKIIHLLEKLPFIELEFNNRVTIFGGSTKITYLLDGKSTPLFRSGLTMKSITGLNIRTIELLPNPTGRYRNSDAIINIVTRKSLFEGLLGQVGLQSSLSAFSFAPTANLELVTKVRKLSLLFNGRVGLSTPLSDNYSFSERTSDRDSPQYQEPYSSVKRENYSTSKSFSPSFRVQASYLLTPKKSLSLLSQHLFSNNSTLANSSTTSLGGSLNDFTLENQLNRQSQFHIVNLTYSTEKLRESGGSLQYKYMMKSDHASDTLLRVVSDGDYLSNREKFEREQNHEIYYSRTIQIDKKQTLSIEASCSLDEKKTDGDLYSYNPLESIWEIEPNHHNYLNSVRLTAALSSSYSILLGKHSLTLSVDPSYIGDYNSITPESSGMAHKDYWIFSPGFTYSITPRYGTLLRARYNRGHSLPSPFMTNPYFDEVDPLYITKGNPNLKPENSDIVSLLFHIQRVKNSYSLNLNYAHTTDGIEMVRDVVESGATLSTYQNIGTKDILSAKFQLKRQIIRQLSGYINLGYSQRWSKFNNNSFTYQSYNFRTALNYRPHRQLNVQLSGDITPSRDRNDIQSGKVYYLFRSRLHLSGNSKDMKFNWGVIVTSLERSNRRILTQDIVNGYIINNSRIEPGRAISFTLSYSFGKINN